MTRICNSCSRIFISNSRLNLVSRHKSTISPVPLAFTSYEKLYKGTNVAEEPLIICHGLFGSRNNWNSLCKAIHAKSVPTRKIISLDARNHGDSPHSPAHSYEHMAEDFTFLMKSLAIPKAVIMGHSMGGRAMAYFALKNPNLVEKAIIVDVLPSKGLGTSQTDIPLFLQAMKAIKIPNEQTIHQGRKTADAQLEEIVPVQSLRDFLITNLVKDGEEFSWRINIEALEQSYLSHIADFPNAEGLQFKGKTLFIGGAKSDFITKEGFKEAQKLFPNSELIFIDGAGHWVHSEKPAQFLDVVLKFLNDES